jgi:hypothetical protein
MHRSLRWKLFSVSPAHDIGRPQACKRNRRLTATSPRYSIAHRAATRRSLWAASTVWGGSTGLRLRKLQPEVVVERTSPNNVHPTATRRTNKTLTSAAKRCTRRQPASGVHHGIVRSWSIDRSAAAASVKHECLTIDFSVASPPHAIDGPTPLPGPAPASLANSRSGSVSRLVRLVATELVSWILDP